MLELLFGVVAAVVVLGLIYWLLTLLPLPEPFPQIVRVVFIVVAILLVIYFLAALVGVGPGGSFLWRK